ncbi:MAG: PilZ domain-containing protein [Deltaproteobacteria bacterium]|nr:PilZ domain-containing protein [Deltaproteobacteria bacterium]
MKKKWQAGSWLNDTCGSEGKAGLELNFKGESKVADKRERRRDPRVEARWPISIITDQGIIEAESRNITVSGIFVHSKEKLKGNKVYQLMISLPKHRPVVVKGKLVWANLEKVEGDEALAGMGFSFIRISEQDQKYLRKIISFYGKKESRKESAEKKDA